MDADDSSPLDLTAVVLAAGAGRRMRSAQAKPLHPLAGRPLLLHVLHALRAAGVPRAVVVTGHQEDAVRAAAAAAGSDGPAIAFAHQAEPRGTGHATLQARDAVRDDHLLVINGDCALVTAEQIRAVATAPPCRVALATARLADPHGYGRVRRDPAGRVRDIVEERDADAETAAITEANAGLYRFDAAWLWPTLAALRPSASGEIYLTDAIAAAAAEPDGAIAVPFPPAPALISDAPISDAPLSIETRADLARAEQVLRSRIAARWLAAGVTIVDPAQTYIDADARIGPDTVLEPGSHLRGRTVIGRDCRIGPNAVIRATRVGDRCLLDQCSVTEATLGNDVTVGPFSTLRAGTVLEDGVYIGTHAETKNAHLRRGVRMGHFSYLGDAEVGAGTNIGAGAITCNFDGTTKHRTVIGEGAFIGSDSLLIAPLTIGDGGATGAGAVVNRDVPAGRRVVGHPARLPGDGEGGAE